VRDVDVVLLVETVGERPRGEVGVPGEFLQKSVS
jgi:hypothetical protein